MAAQNEDQQLKTRFATLATRLAEKQTTILAEIDATRGKTIDIGGYYLPDTRKVTQAMRPSQTFNNILENFLASAAEAPRCAAAGA